MAFTFPYRVALLWIAGLILAGCSGSDADCTSHQDCPADQRCYASGGVLFGGAVCAARSRSELPASPDAADVTSADANCTPRTFYRDGDGDGFGGPEVAMTVCAAPKGFVDNSQDCDDDDPERNPVAVEVCDGGIDNNCDGEVVVTRKSLYFLQRLDRVGIGYRASLDVPGNFTIEAWVKRTGRGGRVFSKFGLGTEDRALGVGAQGSGTGRLRTGADTYRITSIPSQVTEAKWHHLALVHVVDPDRSNWLRIYIDGDLASSARTLGWPVQGERPIFIGALYGGTAADREWLPPMTGFIANVRLSDFARYQGSDFDPEWNFEADERTVGLWRLDEGAGTDVHDTSGGRAHGGLDGPEWKDTECR
jgi:hypothetical protein